MIKLRRETFIFLRHGETECNSRQVIGGRTDSQLTDAGREQARLAAEWLQPLSWSRVVCSSLSRTRETARLAVPGCVPLVVPDLNERDWGELEGQPMANMCAYEATPPGGEPWQLFEHRVTNALNDLLADCNTPLLVGHSGTYRVVCNHIYGRPDVPRIANATPVLFRPLVSGWEVINMRIGHDHSRSYC